MKSRFSQNLSMILISLLLAFILWAVATEGDNPTLEQPLSAALPIKVRGMPEGETYYGVENSRARVVLRAPQSVWDVLRPEDVEAFIDVSQVGTGTHTFPVQVEIHRQPSQLVRVSPDQVQIILEPIAERQIPVVVVPQGTPALGYVVRTPTFAPRTVTLRGPTSIISRVVRAQVIVPVNDQRQDVQGDFPPVPVDETGTAVEAVEVLPRVITVFIPVEQLVNFRNLAVKVNLIGQPAAGYRLVNVEVDPPAVTVFGRNEEVQSIPGYLETTPISLTGLTENVVVTGMLQAPQTLTILPSPEVSVTLNLAPIEGGLTVEVVPQLVGLTSGLTATVEPERIAVDLQGPLPLLDGATNETIQVTLDLKGMAVGEHRVVPKINVPEPLTATRILPETITVRISRVSRRP